MRVKNTKIKNDKEISEPKYGLPKNVKFCKRCVMSNQRPEPTVEFKNRNKKETLNIDEEGVCSACRWYDNIKNRIDWKRREKLLKELCDKYRSKDGSYDCVVPGSGGKDSDFASHVLKYKFGMHPLTVTWTPHLYTDIGWQNFQSWIHKGGFDNILVSPNGKVHSKLTRMAFKNLLHPFQPFILGQKYIGPRIAVKFNIPLVFYGENESEDGNSIIHSVEEINTMHPKYYSQEKIDLSKIFIAGLSAQELIEKHGFTINDLYLYLPLLKEEVEKVDVKVHYMSNFYKWDPQENFYYAAKHCGFKPNTERTEGSYSKYSSVDDRIDPFHYFTTLVKFGIGRASYDASQEIRHNKITREEGVALVKKYDQEFPKKYFKDFLEYIDMDEKEFWKTIEKFRSHHLWKKVDGKWVLRNSIQ